MNIRTLHELQEPEEVVLRFTPLGLSTGSRVLTAEAAARFQQETIGRSDLVAAVPEGTRKSFERLRSLHTYGLFYYELFTAADDLSLLVLGQALQELFVAHFGGAIPFVNKDGECTLQVSSFDGVYDALRGGSLAKGGWLLRRRDSSPAAKFEPTFRGLLKWARMEGLLRGQRNRRLEEVLVRIRNRVAHPSSYGLTTPVDSARSISDIGEIINHLWGTPTPGGRLYPAPILREILAVGWDQSGARRVKLRGEQLETVAEDERDWTYVVVRAVAEDEGVWEFDSRFEVTSFPADLLWGPGS
jgi:hypothetical protein